MLQSAGAGKVSTWAILYTGHPSTHAVLWHSVLLEACADPGSRDMACMLFLLSKQGHSSSHSSFRAAFYPIDGSQHPFFPNGGVSQLTMFADYRVPQILHTLRILTYPDSLLTLIEAGRLLPSGSDEEMSLRAASILAVERIRECIARNRKDAGSQQKEITSVEIDFWLWDMAKQIESGEEKIPGLDVAAQIVPIHRTRSIWY